MLDETMVRSHHGHCRYARLVVSKFKLHVEKLPLFRSDRFYDYT
jgi:hypothetical protein